MRLVFLTVGLFGLTNTWAQTPVKLGGITVPGFSTAKLSPEKFSQLHAAMAPSGPAERWAEIPWQTDLCAARQLSAREHKPLFMWIMDGHPLGCT
jgi:hypothetical protein